MKKHLWKKNIYYEGREKGAEIYMRVSVLVPNWMHAGKTEEHN